MGLHTHLIEVAGDAVVLSASSGLAHVHVGEHPALGGTVQTLPADDTFPHRHGVELADGRVIQTENVLDVDPGTAAEPVVTAKGLPDVLTWDAVRAGRMPESGSGLGPELEAGVPAMYRYWKAAPDQRAAVRRALVESGVMDERSVRPVAVIRDGVRAEPTLMRVSMADDGGYGIVVEPDGDPVVPTFRRDVEIAADLAGVVGGEIVDAAVLKGVTSFGVSFADVVGRFLESGGDWIVEIPAESAAAESLLKRSDACTAFRLHHTNDHVYFASGIPDEGVVRFVTEPDPMVKSAVEIARNTSAVAIEEAGQCSDLTEYQKSLSAAAADLAARSDWDVADLRAAHRIRVIVQSELAKSETSRRTHLLRALGVDTEGSNAVLAKAAAVKIRKFADPGQPTQRLVYGVVLEPGVGDLQGDVLDEATIAAAYYNYVEHHRHIGLQHEEIVLGKAAITQVFLAPVDFVPPGCGSDDLIRKGSWVQEERILCDELWADVLCGKYTGFSIGGEGRRRPL